MTPQEAMDQRIPRIRKPNWANPNAYLRLPLMADGKTGPWAELYDEWGQLACEVKVGSQKLCMLDADVRNETGFERYDGPAHPAENDNYAKVYLEQ